MIICFMLNPDELGYAKICDWIIGLEMAFWIEGHYWNLEGYKIPFLFDVTYLEWKWALSSAVEVLVLSYGL